MKIIFHRYGSICEPDIIDAFQALGLEVIEADTEITCKTIEPTERIRLLAEAVLTHKPAFVFSLNYFPYISDICERLQVLYVALSVDCPVLELFSSTIRNAHNRIFLFDYNQYLQIHEENPTCIFYLPLAANIERWEQIKAGDVSYDVSFVGSLYTEKSPYSALALSDFWQGFGDGLIEAQLKLPGLALLEHALTKEYVQVLKEAAFLGANSSFRSVATPINYFHAIPDSFADTDAYVAANYILGMRVSELERIRTLNLLAEQFDLHLFTRSDTTVLKRVHCHGGVTTHREMPLVFKSSKINLNITIRSIQTGLSQRIWDILGCGGFLLSNYQAEIPEYFEIGRDLECYESIPELKEKIAYYLAHDDIRREIAANGFQKVKEAHTWLNRIVTLLNVVFPPPVS